MRCLDNWWDVVRFDKISDEMCRDVVRGDEMWVDLMHIKTQDWMRCLEMWWEVVRCDKIWRGPVRFDRDRIWCDMRRSDDKMWYVWWYVWWAVLMIGEMWWDDKKFNDNLVAVRCAGVWLDWIGWDGKGFD
jgi:hypothetical protein